MNDVPAASHKQDATHTTSTIKYKTGSGLVDELWLRRKKEKKGSMRFTKFIKTRLHHLLSHLPNVLSTSGLFRDDTDELGL